MAYFGLTDETVVSSSKPRVRPPAGGTRFYYESNYGFTRFATILHVDYDDYEAMWTFDFVVSDTGQHGSYRSANMLGQAIQGFYSYLRVMY